jgi:hypothetical protein
MLKELEAIGNKMRRNATAKKKKKKNKSMTRRPKYELESNLQKGLIET